MKRTFIALLLVTFFVTGAAFGVARWLRCRGYAASVRPDLVRELHLSGTQAAEIAKLQTEYRKRLDEICVAHCAARSALAEALPDRDRAADCCAKMCAAQTDAEKAALEQIFKICALLTPDQQQRYLALVRQQLTGVCPMRMSPP